MNLRKLPILAATALAFAGVYGCNSAPSDPVNDDATTGSVEVKSFALKANDKILTNLDSVYFSIDLANYRIYNADSLPKGTDVSRLVVKLSTATVSRCELLVDRGEKGDTTYNYLANQNDSIDFSHGPVTLRITSQDGTLTRDYEVKVNVHLMEPDSLAWDQAMMRALPTNLPDVACQKTVTFKDKAWCLTTNDDGSKACLAVADNPLDEWTFTTPTLPANAIVSSLEATTDALFLLDASGEMYNSEDGATWTDTGVRCDNLLGGYGSDMFATVKDADNVWHITSWPGAMDIVAPEGFPVSGTSQMLVYESRWTPSLLAVFVGGRKADGSLSGDTWAYDGSRWARINPSKTALTPAEDYALVPYFAFRTHNNWTISEETIMIAVGGRDDSGEPVRDLYVSFDRGIHWSAASNLMQLPGYMPSFYGAQALCFDTHMTLNNEWAVLTTSPLPRWLRPTLPVSSRVSEPITEWECPAIYLFGGYDAYGNLLNSVWHGVINRLTFCPLY